MREERGQIAGDQVISEPLDARGTYMGSVKVVDGGKVYVRGAIYGNLTVEDGGRVHIFGHIGGSLTVMEGAKVIHEGTVSGDANNNGGRLYIKEGARVLGRVRTRDGTTSIDPKAHVRQ